MQPSWLPARGEIFLDERGPHRTLRVSRHDEEGLVVLSLWRGGMCTGTFRLPVEDIPDLVDVLRRGLDQAYGRTYDGPAARRSEPAAG